MSPASGKGFDTALSYTGMMQTIGFSGNRPINGVVAANGSGIGIGSILDSLYVPTGLFDAAIQGSAYRMPSRSFTNIGPNWTSDNRFRDATFFLDQRVGESLNLQLSGGINRLYTYGLIDYYTNNNYPNVYIDLNRLLPDGTSNPNFLEPYNEFTRPERTQIFTTNKALRAAAAYVKNTRWVDVRANVLGAVEKTNRFVSREYFMVPVDPDPRAWGLISSTRTQTLRYRYYWNQTERAIQEMKAITLVDPVAGTAKTYNPLWVLGSDRNDATTLNKATTKYFQASANLAFWKKRFILLGAFRSDQVDRNQELFLRPMDHPADYGALTLNHFRWRPAAPADYWKLSYTPKDATGKATGPLQPAPATRPRDTTTGLALSQYANDRFQDDFNPPPTSTRKPTKSLGGIINIGRGVSLWANIAQTFNPSDFSKTTIDYGTPPPSVSEGKDYGVRFSIGPRLYATVSRYESKEQDAVSGTPTGVGNFQTIISTNVLNDLSSEGRNRQGLGDMPVSWVDVMDRKTRGYELEVVANPTANWRLTFNYGLADGTQTDAYRQTRAWLTSHDALLRKILDDAGIQFDGSNVASAKSGVTSANSPDLTNAVLAWNSLQTSQASWVSGTQVLQRLTKYTANFYSDYRFLEGRLRGLRLGYGMQFRGPQALGFRGADTIVNPANPSTTIDNPAVDAYTVVWQKAYSLATATIGYPVKIVRQKIDLNLSITNLFNYDLPIYNTVGIRATNGDISTPARTTYPRFFSYTTPRSFRLSATYTY